MSTVRIRKAAASDLEALQEFARRTIDCCYRPFLGDANVDWFIDSGESDRTIETHLDHCDVLLLCGVPVAHAVFFDDLIHLLMVDVRLHRQGIGSRLLAHCEAQLFAQGNTALRLETFEGNQQAIGFYLKNGWTITGKQQDPEHDFVRVCFSKSPAQPTHC